MERSELIRDLKERLRRWEGVERGAAEAALSTGSAELDRLLPQGGLALGTLLEWLSVGEGAGAATLTLVLAARVQKQGSALVVIDESRDFYPPGAAYLGIDLEQTLVVQPANPRDALWAWEQALRSPAACAVWGSIERLDDRSFRRLQLAAEAGQSLGLLLRPETCRRATSWAEARLLVSARPLSGKGNLRSALVAPGRRWRIELLHCRGGFGGGAVFLELSHEAGDVHLAAALADPAPPRGAARA